MRCALALVLAASAAAWHTSDKDANCPTWADSGECEKNPGFMKDNCAKSCLGAGDVLGSAVCAPLVMAGRCADEPAAAGCIESCFKALRSNLTEDQEGNCWYWGTDGECEANPAWMAKSCPRSCAKLVACGAAPHTAACAAPFECPLRRDSDGATAECLARARGGGCRSTSVWRASALLSKCPYACALVDPASASHAVTRPMVKRSAHIDAEIPRHRRARCAVGRLPALLAGKCPSERPGVGGSPWSERRRGCPRGALASGPMTPRLLDARLPSAAVLPNIARGALPADHAVRLQVVHDEPRVRLLHGFVSADEALRLVELAMPLYHRSSTARAGSDDKRTSHSASLPSHDPTVRALRHRIAFFCGYPESNLEPLQAVKYLPGEFYKPHHDYYNSCETWQNGNRHFTFLIYLNEVEAGGETAFPRLNLTITPSAYSALVFNNCLDNGEPDERSLHEGVAPTAGVKYAINGWVRSKHLNSFGG